MQAAAGGAAGRAAEELGQLRHWLAACFSCCSAFLVRRETSSAAVFFYNRWNHQPQTLQSLLLLLGALGGQCTLPPRQRTAAAAAITDRSCCWLRLVEHRRHLCSRHNDSALRFSQRQEVFS